MIQRRTTKFNFMLRCINDVDEKLNSSIYMYQMVWPYEILSISHNKETISSGNIIMVLKILG